MGLSDREDGDTLNNNRQLRKRGGFGGKENEFSLGHFEFKTSTGHLAHGQLEMSDWRSPDSLGLGKKI